MAVTDSVNKTDNVSNDSLAVKNKVFLEAIELLINDVMMKPYPYQEKKKVINCILTKAAAFLDIQKIDIGQDLLDQFEALH